MAATHSVMTDKENAGHIAKATVMPSVNAAAVLADYAKSFGEQNISELIDQLRTKFDEVKDGDLHHCEAMLVGQAHALQSIFVNLARRAVNQEYLKNYETFLRLALKAQNQSRMTLETLAALKNPPVVFAKQANINHGNGNQQVNNGAAAPASHAGKNINQQNELLEVQHGSKALDNRPTGTTIGKDKAMAALG
ncbi:hypothetical protein ANAEL_04664 [Anaerolineales bacterium]|nr:hypothetical protein ANAEL_04664 [Anaerolineales bacterium]